MRGPFVFDVEAVPVEGAEQYLEPVSAPSNYSKPDAIERYVQKAAGEQLAKCALDPDLACLVAIGAMAENETEPTVWLIHGEGDERDALRDFWKLVTPYPFPTLVGFNVVGYDLLLMLRRSLYLGVPAPSIQVGKYRHPDVKDLMLMLSFDGALKYRSLDFYCKRFGLDVPADEHDGSDIGRLVAEGAWESVSAHCRADVLKTAALARRIGVIRQPEPVGAF